MQNLFLLLSGIESLIRDIVPFPQPATSSAFLPGWTFTWFWKKTVQRWMRRSTFRSVFLCVSTLVLSKINLKKYFFNDIRSVTVVPITVFKSTRIQFYHFYQTQLKPVRRVSADANLKIFQQQVFQAWRKQALNMGEFRVAQPLVHCSEVSSSI